MAAGVWSGAFAELLDLTAPVNLDTNVLTITESPGFVMDRLVKHEPPPPPRSAEVLLP